MNSPSASLDAIHNVDDDVLTTIFLHCIPTDLLKIKTTPNDPPLLLTHVCKHWRTVALNYPYLWRTLSFDLTRKISLDEFTHSSFERNLVAANAWRVGLFELAKGLKINIHLSTNPDRITLCNTFIDPMAQPLYILQTPFTQSIARLTLRGPTLAQLNKLQPGPFPALERLVLSCHGNIAEPVGVLDAFESAPNLQYASLYMPFCGVHANILLPWSQLTQLDHRLEGATDDFFSTILPSCTQLQQLNILADVNPEILWDLENDNAQPSILTQLHTLSISFADSGDPVPVAFIELFRLFRFPNLRRLTLDGLLLNFQDDIWWMPDLVQHFLDMISSCSRLEHIAFSLIYGADETNLRAILENAPQLTSLDLQIALSIETVLKLLTSKSTETTTSSSHAQLLPNLRTLSMDASHLSTSWNNQKSQTIRDFVEARIPGCLQKVVIYAGEGGRDTLNHIHGLVAELCSDFKSLTIARSFDGARLMEKDPELQHRREEPWLIHRDIDMGV